MKKLKLINDNYICEECNSSYSSYSSYSSIIGLITHINKKHFSSKTYYDKWLKTNSDGKCICGKETKFLGIHKGYKNFCCTQHRYEQTHITQQTNNINNYGVKFNFQRKDIIEKIKITNLKNHNGVFSSSTPEVINKSKQTRKEKYGDENYTNILKSKQTKKEKYGDENYTNRIKAGKTNTEKYGNISPLHGTNQIKKKKETWIKNYGVDNPLKNKEIFNKAFTTRIQIKKYGSLTYQGSYEYDFLEKFYSIFPDMIDGLSFNYKLNENEHIYHSDFFIPSLNLIVEIKNSYLAKKDKDKIAEKKQAVLNNGHNYIMIVDKHYKFFNQIWQKPHQIVKK